MRHVCGGVSAVRVAAAERGPAGGYCGGAQLRRVHKITGVAWGAGVREIFV
jgi:hypothetical protein